MQHDWFMYHLRSIYTNRLEFPFKSDVEGSTYNQIISKPHHSRGIIVPEGTFVGCGIEEKKKIGRFPPHFPLPRRKQPNKHMAE